MNILLKNCKEGKKQMNPLVSVLVPSYNHSEFITETLLSLCEQTYKNIELIIIDDGSNDNSVEIIEQCIPNVIKNTKSVQFIQQSNAGICRTMNKGLELATGKYFCILPSDDIMHRDFLEKQIRFLENSTFSCSYTNGTHIDTAFLDNKEYHKGVPFSDSIPFKSGNINSFLLDYVFKLPSPSFVYRRSIIQEIGGFDNRIHFEDVDLMLRISKRYEIGFINEQLFLHRIHKNNSGRNKDIIAGSITILEKKYIEDNYLSLNEDKLAILANHFAKVRQDQLNPNPKKFWFDIDVKSLKVLAKDKKLVAWGTGEFAEIFLSQYPNLVFEYFIDSKKVGKWNGYEIKSPEYLKGETNVYLLVLSSFNLEIELELSKMGFKFEKDFQ